MYTWKITGDYNQKKDISLSILEGRGVKDIDLFLKTPTLNESFESLSSDFKKSLSKARDLIFSEMEKNTPILIFGDYDSDGINATAILYNFFKYEKKYDKVSYFIPNRFEHNYGLSKLAIDEALDNYKSDEKVLFITVDVGVTAFEEISYIKKLGHSVILTDHHQKPEKVPTPDLLVWNDGVCGAAIAWLLSKALGSKSRDGIVNASVATVTDLIPLTGFNRIIVKKGLEVINSNPPLWIKKLFEVSSIKDIEITTYEIGWAVGPRLNASGRLKSSEDSIRLLTEHDETVLEKLSSSLNSKNIERQEKTIEMYDMASEIDEKNLPKIIFSSNEKFHEGVIGLVSAKLTQRYYRPSVVISLEDGYGKGSVRSIPGVNIIEILRKFNDLFVDLGGHPMAGGFTIEKKNIPEMQKKVSQYIEKEFDDDIFVPVLNIDLKIPSDILNVKILDEIDKLKPFGMGNEQPLFLTENFVIVNSDIIGKDKTHLKLKLYDGNKYHKAVYFGGARYEKDLAVGDKVDLVYMLNKNEYNGNTYLDLVIKDFRKV
ncbi:MAG TPA: single-stranded-DNA-specific exonuclease RecJ [Patescibacteria group bacterium]|nr:single-stranded-DNA-specific exonuclease RecJ [bacterium]HRY56917.1 single-stranded-DNA-specific exonuclease RecJ [Patescibacteria group bacterium]